MSGESGGVAAGVEYIPESPEVRFESGSGRMIVGDHRRVIDRDDNAIRDVF